MMWEYDLSVQSSCMQYSHFDAVSVQATTVMEEVLVIWTKSERTTVMQPASVKGLSGQT